MSLDWKSGTGLTDVLVDSKGKIVGEVGKQLGTGYYASVGKERIGEYYTALDAKAAVVDAVLKGGNDDSGH